MPPRRAARTPQSAATLAERSTPAPAHPPLAALLQRAAAPATLQPQDVAALHQSIGNRAVMQLMQQGVIQRGKRTGKTKKVKRVVKQPGRNSTRRAAIVLKQGKIASVSFKNVHRPSTGKSKQGDHVSAFVGTTAMLKNAVHGILISEFNVKLTPVIQHIMGLSGMSNRRWGPYLRQRIQQEVIAPADEIATNGGTSSDIGAVLYDLASIVNQIPGGTIINATSTGGHNEGYKSVRLQDAEQRLNNGKNMPYAKYDLADDMWGMFDYHPTKSIKNGTIINRIVDHINNMAMAYPRTAQHIGGKQYLHERLESTHAVTIFNKMSGLQARIHTILEKVDEAI